MKILIFPNGRVVAVKRPCLAPIPLLRVVPLVQAGVPVVMNGARACHHDAGPSSSIRLRREAVVEVRTSSAVQPDPHAGMPRLYPVGADVAPPADVGALARWMERWGLLPADTPRAVAQHQLEALTSPPVETVDAEEMPDTTTSQILRLPAEWEPSEAVVITWPVLFPGFWGFYRDLVAAIAPAARVDVLIPHAIYAPAVLAYLGEGWHDDRRLRLLVTASDDIWVRDYGPLTCIDKAGQRVMVDAIFDPPPTPFANDDSFPVRYAAHQGCFSRHLALHLEGGNLWSTGRAPSLPRRACTPGISRCRSTKCGTGCWRDSEPRH